MILDLVLEENIYWLKIHKNFFQNKSVPVEVFQADCPLTRKYSYLKATFQIGEPTFGFAGCFQKQEEEGDYIIYKFNFPDADNSMAMRQMLLTIYLATYYVVESMYHHKEFFTETIWDDQAFSFIIFDEAGRRGGYSIGGWLYPWFKRKLAALSSDDLRELNQYVLAELKRVSVYFYKQELHYVQVTIAKESFFVQVDTDGRWMDWKRSRDADRPEEFSSHNIDHFCDQMLCFVAIVAINTWLRKN